MKKVLAILTTLLLLVGIAVANEKPVNVKGVSLGMPIDKAREVLSKVLEGDWKITAKGEAYKVLMDYRFGNIQIFGTTYLPSLYNSDYSGGSPAIIGSYGFAISRNNSYEGFISGDSITQKVTRISISGEITEALYNTNKKQKLNMDEFVAQFTQHFSLPEFNWIPFGWMYQSPNGYTITLRTNKLIDIKTDEKKTEEPQNETGKIKF